MTAISDRDAHLGDRVMGAFRGHEFLGFFIGNLYDDNSVNWFKAARKGIQVFSLGTDLVKIRTRLNLKGE